ncbi:uncharacterized protein K452DRAFT_287369 [Aplosporella prunicola CBS 121167]|uniref:Conidiation-specific protein 8 n=1 Tax=Aplosporella prunicola CBS 121167 TaxID=1176127 RepID=A0A6A6BD86_9PEZI|nr:uncharacterized protein K452DRAFT_287369 [Aplosporella prunicola CBS 121167]KAF2142152.1 hypothetical protein K452DRAFT_287369 [Aplosporella prunicola CBS 121167]
MPDTFNDLLRGSKLPHQANNMTDPNPKPTERRRSSGSERFANLTAAKRDPNNERTSASRASFSDQNRKPGFLGQMWQNYTRGSATSPDQSSSGTK